MKLEFNSSNTFCISLDLNRWKSMQERFEYFQLNVTRWAASTPDTLVDTFVSNLNERQKACAQSHINIYKHMINNQLPYTLIMEDDARFDKNWQIKLKTIEPILDIDPNWDLILLNASEPITPMHQWQKQTEQYLCACYVISLKGAKTIIDMFNKYYCSSDWMTTRLELLGHSYSYFPWLVIQEGSYSTLQNKIPTEDYNKVIRCLNDVNYSLNNYI